MSKEKECRISGIEEFRDEALYLLKGCNFIWSESHAGNHLKQLESILPPPLKRMPYLLHLSSKSKGLQGYRMTETESDVLREIKTALFGVKKNELSQLALQFLVSFHIVLLNSQHEMPKVNIIDMLFNYTKRLNLRINNSDKTFQGTLLNTSLEFVRFEDGVALYKKALSDDTFVKFVGCTEDMKFTPIMEYEDYSNLIKLAYLEGNDKDTIWVLTV